MPIFKDSDAESWQCVGENEDPSGPRTTKGGTKGQASGPGSRPGSSVASLSSGETPTPFREGSFGKLVGLPRALHHPASNQARAAALRARRQSSMSFWAGLWLLLKPVLKLGRLSMLSMPVAFAVAWHVGGQISRTFAAVADVAEGSSRVATAVLNSGVSLSSGATTFVAGAAASGLAVSTEIWRGVDLYNITVRQHAHQAIADDPLVVKAWLESDAGRRAAPLADEPRQLVADIGASVGVAMPKASHSSTLLHVNGELTAISVEAQLLDSGYVAVAWTSSNVVYNVRWSNPVWAGLEFDVEEEYGQITAQLERLLAAVPPVRTTPLYGAAFASTPEDLPLLVSARLRLYGRYVWLCWRSAMGALWAGPWPFTR